LSSAFWKQADTAKQNEGDLRRIAAMDQDRAFEEARKRSIDQLQRLYALVAGLAATEVLRRVFNTSGDKPLIRWLALVSFFFLLVPFYHGAHRHLDDTYVLGLRQPKKDQFLLVDFAAFFLEALLFFLLALCVNDPEVFFRYVIALLVVDFFWVLSTKWTSSVTPLGQQIYEEVEKHRYWAYVNICIAAFLALLALTRTSWEIANGGNEWLFSWMCGLIVVRTILDYYFTWQVYYPKKSA
jgi:hypothetical protein